MSGGNSEETTAEPDGNSERKDTSSTITQEEEGTEEYYDRIARKMGGRTTRKVLAKLQQVDKASSIGKDIGKSAKTVEYHIEKLSSENLIQEIGDTDSGASAWKTTELGKIILQRVNVPE
ncbi:MAG: hypothetical protein ABEJ69_02825 [Candidatus Nanohaloarchaea archaeon]